MLSVYLADDEFYVRTSLKNNIPWEENGFLVIGEANNGKTAYDQILRFSPDLAIIDINMPGYNGLELIEHLSGKNIKCRFIILTGYGEFQYAQQALRLGVEDYILKPIDYNLLLQSIIDIRQDILEESAKFHEIQNLQQENEQFTLDQFFNDLINCSLISSQASHYSIDSTAVNTVLAYHSFTVIMIKPLTAADPQKIRDLTASLSGLLPFTSCQDYKKLIYLICDTPKQNILDFFLSRLLLLLDQETVGSVIGIGSTYSSFEQIYLSYNEACIALKNRHSCGERLLYYNRMETSGYNGLDTKSKLLFKTYILDKDIRKLAVFLLDYYDTLGHLKASFSTCVLYTIEFIYLLTEILSSQSSQPVCVIKPNENILDALGSIPDISALCQWLTRISVSAIENFDSGAEKISDVTQDIEDYIKEEYSKPDLSIPVLAENLFLNYSYLCFCFKRDKGITINDYLNQVRLNKAMELLAAGIENISYIAEKTGFNNAGYFSKKFKKATGLTPSEYRRTLNSYQKQS